MKTVKIYAVIFFLAAIYSFSFSQTEADRVDEFRAGSNGIEEKSAPLFKYDNVYIINDSGLVFILNKAELFENKDLSNNNNQKKESNPEINIPEKFDMLQNFPNPFNPETLIKYQLPESSYLSIKLYDQLGREISVLFDGVQNAGFYQITLDGTDMASGIYFCRITSSNSSSGSAFTFNKTIKMLLIK